MKVPNGSQKIVINWHGYLYLFIRSSGVNYREDFISSFDPMYVENKGSGYRRSLLEINEILSTKFSASKLYFASKKGSK